MYAMEDIVYVYASMPVYARIIIYIFPSFTITAWMNLYEHTVMLVNTYNEVFSDQFQVDYKL